MISVIIPTRNRNVLLVECLRALLSNSIKPQQIIVIDSSDWDIRKKIDHLSPTIKHVFTEIKSAARQRNIGLNMVDSNSEYIAFIDDDVLVPENYFEKLTSSIERFKLCGISGLSINVEKQSEQKPVSKVKETISRLFLLDSNSDGVLLNSGVNVPVKTRSAIPIESEWLIGCSIWDYSIIKDLRFEEDFYGMSLGEDVIFSLKASRRGKLAVDTNVILNHLESPLLRPNDEAFMYMWVRNRMRIIKEMQPGSFKYLAYHWANLGKLFQVIFVSKQNKLLKIKGILNGYRDLYR